MVKINNSTVDIVLQAEEHTNVQKIFDLLTLDVNHIMIISPEMFLQRFIHFNQDEFSTHVIEAIEEQLKKNNGFVSIDLAFKNKYFHFHFIILSSEIKKINHPFKGDQEFKAGFKQIYTE